MFCSVIQWVAMGAALEVIQSAAAAEALLPPQRQRLLQHLHEPDSAAGLARRLSLPRQQVNYHLRELEKHGLVELVEERRKGNCMERVVRASARSYVISPLVLGDAEAPTVRDQFSSTYLIAAAARTLRDTAVLRQRADAAGQRLATLTVETDVRFASAADRAAFTEELTSTLARLTQHYHQATAPGGRSFRFLLAAYPTPAKKEKDNEPRS
ncbi:MAG: helix-turn-helix domain-containing protein [Bryobacteraceae bacterium]|nr:helix-turn-helix domain-containing protein [Bryobacteraceae bacterium]